MSTTYPHRRHPASPVSTSMCRCGDATFAHRAEWGHNCAAALRERVAELERAAGPHIPPALLRRIEALGFTPGSGEPVGWLVAELERLKADHTALLLGVGHPMWLPSVADAVDHPGQFNATPDEVLVRVRAVVAERDELAATLANERTDRRTLEESIRALLERHLNGWTEATTDHPDQPELGPKPTLTGGVVALLAERDAALAHIAAMIAADAARSAGGGGS